MSKHSENTEFSIPEPTLKRLPVYLNYLQHAKESGLLTISAPVIGKALGYDHTQVVKDIAYTGAKGRPRIGYNIYEVVQHIENFLGFNLKNEAFLIGAGNLGTALMAYPNLKDFGIQLIAAFDSDPDKTGKTKSGINILHTDKFKDLREKLDVRIAVLTTPAEVAQQVTDFIIECGIEAIWNLSPVHLQVSANVIVQNTSMYSNVAVLLKKWQHSKKTQHNK